MDADANLATWTHEEGLAAGERCLAAALDYLRLGWSVLCLCPPDHAGVGKSHGATCDHWGKRPIGDNSRWKGRQTVAATEAEVRAWWRVQPNANVGVALGPVSGVVRVDLEGEAAMNRFREISGGDQPATPAFTSGKGWGLLYGLPPGVEARTGVEGLSDGELRIQGLGAQTVLPPSRHVSGRRYAWLEGRSPHEIAVAPAPAWLLERLKSGTKIGGGTSIADGELIPQGKRDDTLTSMGGVMRHRGFGESAIRNALAAENLERCDPPLDEAQVAKIARSVAGYEPDAYADVTILRPSVNGQAAPAPGTAFRPPVPISLLRKVSEEAKWLWRGYLSYGGITLLSSLWKAGKTTLQSHLLKALGGETGETFCGTAVRPARVLYVTEEPESLWAERRDKMGLGDWIEVMVRPFVGKPNMGRWLEFLDYLKEICPQRGYQLVVFDTISNLWPVQDENDAAKVQTALMPLRSVSESVSILLDHHLRKGDGQEATASRGSGALLAFVDTLLELRRYAPGDRKDARRVLTGYGRYQETPPEAVLELTATGYVYRGEKTDLRNADLHAVLLPQIPTTPPGYTAEQIHAVWQGGAAPGVRAIHDALRAGAENGHWVETGEGHKGDRYRFWRPPADS